MFSCRTYKIGCPALIAASVDREKQKIVIRTINLNHSHPMLGHMYPENRRQSLTPNVLSEAYRLIDIGVKTKNVREYISSVTGKQLTTRDINNLKAKRKKELMTVHNCNNNNTESPPPNKKKKKISKETEMSSPISSHVFDISKGLPATGLPVLLFLQVEKRAWKLLQKSASGIDGHVTFLSGQKIYKTNVYKLLFDTESYFKITDQTAFYPFIEIVFQVTDPNHNHHIPIQISPHSYSCHRELTQQESDLVLAPSPQTASPSCLS